MSKKIAIDASDVILENNGEDTVLETAEKSGYSIPYSCRKGVCSTCVGELLEGTVETRSQRAVAPRDDVLFCQAKPVTDVIIRPSHWAEYDPASRKTIGAKIKKISWLTDQVAEVVLKFPIGVRAIFGAGQYLNVHFGDTSRSYSMANPPHKNTEVLLHVRKYDGGAFSDVFLSEATENDTVKVEIPFGEVQLKLDSPDPLVVLATGTGFAPVQSIMGQLIRSRIHRPVHFFWGARHEEDLYGLDLVRSWEKKFDWFTFTPVLSRPGPDWSGSEGWVQSVARERISDLTQCSVYACGNHQMITEARDLFTAAGLAPTDFHCDSFVPALDETVEAL